MHPAPLSHHPQRKRKHENRLCRCTISLYAGSTSPSAWLTLLVVLLSCTCLLRPVSAAQSHAHRFCILDDPLAWERSSLRLDTRPPPIIPLLMPPVLAIEYATKTLSAPLSKRSLATASSTSAADFPLPKPFDTGLSNNFTSSCANFMNNWLQSDALNSCHPFSLLLQTSSGFFDASKSFFRITQTLEATCAASESQCTGILDGFARELLSDTACRTDYNNDNPLVLQAYNGLVAYKPSYQASCLRDEDGNYCFANAVSNSSSTTDSYPFYLPIGQELPGGSRPTCNSCLQDTMAIYASFANNATQPLSKTYTSAAQQLSISCGSRFVNITAAPLKGAAAPASSASLTPTFALMLIFVLFLFPS
ncbi:uncharacterized protein EKO05_0004185 [Ascochyta rabiei]|uniref:DUF7729 domain-containing protein n=1 Tax=Didymella rabiei TaxID=5454 RepID=A0A162XI58_DIDRA|nr:uncharacterized protein EKO05_0004185 [Ascochyta rabiei]KZM19560.1 hypothetical protein ST47_g9135 [Ascochyta rabiei]UPX13686.1 hypothetical protein EKO05_0004185 [Ascochyta rabiei]